MKTTAISQAALRLNSARQAVERMKGLTQTQAQLVQSWVEFLTACGAIYEKLKLGADGCGKSAAWFGRKVAERRKDPLLSYIHQARNSEEHGIAEITELVPFVRVSGPLTLENAAWVKNDQGHITGCDVQFNRDPEVGEKVGVEVFAKVDLVAVTNTIYEDTFEPPNSHLGKVLSDTSPYGVAEAALTYFEALIAEALTLPQRK